MHVFCGMPFNAKQTAYWKSLKFVPVCFFNFWSSSNHKWRRQQQWHLTKGFICTLAFIFLHIYPLLYAKKIRECHNQKFKVLRTQTFNRITSNSKRARTKFKLIGKFKMPRKLKQQKAFPARSLSFFFIYSLLYAKQQGFETEHKYFAIKYQIQNVRVQSLS